MEVGGNLPAKEKKRMKKSLLALVLGAALLPLTFAAQAPSGSSQPAAGSQAPSDSAKNKKKGKKHHRKNNKKSGETGATSNPSTPAPKN
jgi:hypothetical protein